MFDVFVYGSLKRGFRNHSFLDRCRFVGTGLTRPEFDLLDLGHFPALIRPGNFSVQGELFSVNRGTLARLDFLEGNGVFYGREQHPVTIEGAGEVSAWVYLLLDPERHPAVACDGPLKVWTERR